LQEKDFDIENLNAQNKELQQSLQIRKHQLSKVTAMMKIDEETHKNI